MNKRFLNFFQMLPGVPVIRLDDERYGFGASETWDDSTLSGSGSPVVKDSCYYGAKNSRRKVRKVSPFVAFQSLLTSIYAITQGFHLQ